MDWVPGSRVLQMAACRPRLEAKVCAESRLGIAYITLFPGRVLYFTPSSHTCQGLNPGPLSQPL